MKNHTFWLCNFVLSISLVFPGLVSAQQAVGVVTALKGEAQLTRAATQTALRFKDDLILRDVINTEEKSLTRVLFGGKSTVTMHELSSLEIREELLPGGGTRTIHNLSSGSILVNVARSLLGRGDEVQIRTPNAVATVQGSAVFVQYNLALAQSVVAVLTGSAVVTPQGQPPITLTPNTSVNVTSTAATGVQAGPRGTVTQAEANEIAAGSAVGPTATGESADAGVQEAVVLLEVVVAVAPNPVETFAKDEVPKKVDVVTDPDETTAVVEEVDEEPDLGGGNSLSQVQSDSAVQALILEQGGEIPTEVALPSLTASELPFIFATDTTSSRNPFFKLTNDTLSVSGNLILFKSGASVTLVGRLLDATNSALTIGSAALSRRDILRVEESGTSLSGTGTDPLITVNPSTFTIGRFLDVRGGATVNLAGPLLSDSGSTFTVERDFVDVRQLNSKLTGTGTTPLLQFSSSTLNVGTKGIGSTGRDIGVFFRVDDNVITDVTGPASVTLAGPLVSDTGSTFDILLRFLRVEDGSTFTSTTSDSLIAFSGSTVGTGLDFALLDDSSTVSLSGPFVNALSNTKFTTGTGTTSADFLDIRDSGTVFTGPSKPTTGDASPLITFDQTTLTTNVPITSSDTRFLDLSLSGKLQLGGPLLKATNSTFTTNADFARVTQLATLTGTGTTALFDFTNSTFNIGSDTVQSATTGGDPGDNFFRVDDSSDDVITGAATVTLAGPLVSDSGSTFTIADDFLRVVDGSTLTSTSTSPLITLTGSTVNVKDDLIRIDDSAKVTLSGSLLSAGTTLNIATDPAGFGDLVDIQTGGQLVMNSADPVVLLNGGTHTIGTADTTTNNTSNRMFGLSGRATDSAGNDLTDAAGLGTDQPIKGNGVNPAPFTGASNPIGTLLKATGGATVEVKIGANDASGGRAVRLDTALYEATLPIIDLVGSASTQTILTTARDTIRMDQSKAVSLGPVIALDKGLINVTSGALIRLNSGSNWNVTGDLLKLISGSKINVVNGPLIRVDGTSAKGAASQLSISGALVNFGGTGGNTIIVRNGLCSGSCATKGASSFNVLEQCGGTITISGTDVKNPSLGSFDVGATDAVIQVRNSGTVTIQGN